MFSRLIAHWHTLPKRWVDRPMRPYATADGAGLLYRGTEFVEALAERDDAAAYSVVPEDGRAVETRLDVRRL